MTDSPLDPILGMAEGLPSWISSTPFSPTVDGRFCVTIKENGIDRVKQVSKDASLLEKSFGLCTFCGRELYLYPGETTTDHLVPRDCFAALAKQDPKISGAGNYEDNVVACCIACNLLKGNWPLTLQDKQLPSGLLALSKPEYIKEAHKYIQKKRLQPDNLTLANIASKWKTTHTSPLSE